MIGITVQLSNTGWMSFWCYPLPGWGRECEILKNVLISLILLATGQSNNTFSTPCLKLISGAYIILNLPPTKAQPGEG